MPNLKSMESARHGWDLYLSSKPRRSRDQINEALNALGMVDISDRMYTHYRRLERFGRKTYVPINELDMAVKAT